MLLEGAVERSRPRIMAARVRANAVWLAQAAIATSVAWILAQQLFGHERPIFAPVAALIGVSASLGQRRRAAVEMVIGIALGVGIADALVVLIGTLAVGGRAPRPRKLRLASATTTRPSENVIWTSSGPLEFGSTWRPRRREVEHPNARDAST